MNKENFLVLHDFGLAMITKKIVVRVKEFQLVSRVNKPSLRALIVSIICVVMNLAYAEPTKAVNAWVEPMYPSESSVTKKMRVISSYSFQVRSFEPPFVIQSVSKEKWKFDTPENVMIARVSAMMMGDYDSWLDSWDRVSKEELILSSKARGKTPEVWIKDWRGLFSKARMVLFHRVERSPYVILTYRIENHEPKTSPIINNIELPTVFKKVGDRWFVTNDLRMDTLLRVSPWVSGDNQIVEVVK